MEFYKKAFLNVTAVVVGFPTDDGKVTEIAYTIVGFYMHCDCGGDTCRGRITCEWRNPKMLGTSDFVVTSCFTYISSIAAWTRKFVNDMRIKVRRDDIFEFQQMRNSTLGFINNVNFTNPDKILEDFFDPPLNSIG